LCRAEAGGGPHGLAVTPPVCAESPLAAPADRAAATTPVGRGPRRRHSRTAKLPPLPDACASSAHAGRGGGAGSPSAVAAARPADAASRPAPPAGRTSSGPLGGCRPHRRAAAAAPAQRAAAAPPYAVRPATAGVHAAGRAAVLPTAAAAAYATSRRLGAQSPPPLPVPARAFSANPCPPAWGGDAPSARASMPAAAAPPTPPAELPRSACGGDRRPRRRPPSSSPPPLAAPPPPLAGLRRLRDVGAAAVWHRLAAPLGEPGGGGPPRRLRATFAACRAADRHCRSRPAVIRWRLSAPGCRRRPAASVGRRDAARQTAPVAGGRTRRARRRWAAPCRRRRPPSDPRQRDAGGAIPPHSLPHSLGRRAQERGGGRAARPRWRLPLRRRVAARRSRRRRSHHPARSRRAEVRAYRGARRGWKLGAALRRCRHPLRDPTPRSAGSAPPSSAPARPSSDETLPGGGGADAPLARAAVPAANAQPSPPATSPRRAGPASVWPPRQPLRRSLSGRRARHPTSAPPVPEPACPPSRHRRTLQTAPPAGMAAAAAAAAASPKCLWPQTTRPPSPPPPPQPQPTPPRLQDAPP